jgi:hypothetical protein
MPPLEILRLALLVTHFIGLAAIIGSFIFQLPKRSGFDFRSMFIGSIVQLASGIGLIAVRKIEGLDVIDEKMLVKLILAVVVLLAVILGRRGSASRPLFLIAGVVAIANVVVATVWH